VNVITREGGKKYFGTLEGVTDNLSGRWLGSPRMDYNIYNASLGGPLLPGRDRATFFLSGERRWARDRAPSFMSDDFRRQLRKERAMRRIRTMESQHFTASSSAMMT